MSTIPFATRVLLAIVLVGLVLTAAVLPSPEAPRPTDAVLGRFTWDMFLYGVPLLLAASLLFGLRWVLMAAVMYGTIGLALDLSTLIQTWSRPGAALLRLLSSASAVLNAVLVVIAGAAFLDVRPEASRVQDQR